MKILIMGLPGSGKSTLAEPLARLVNGVWLNADQVRNAYNDWDFSTEGRIRQSQRMRYLADGVVRAGKIAVVDFVCPTEVTRQEFAADYLVWMDTIKSSKFEDTNNIFETPKHVDYHVSAWFNDTHKQLFEVLSHYLNSTDKNR